MKKWLDLNVLCFFDRYVFMMLFIIALSLSVITALALIGINATGKI